MSAIVTDQFRILNANNFVESVDNTSNSYYIFLGLTNPAGAPTLVGYGRKSAKKRTLSRVKCKDS